MKTNYAAWDVKSEDFLPLSPECRRAFLLRFAVLAPSSHNSQPWKFSFEGDSVLISPDFSRVLPASDKGHRELYISIGCALQNFLVAAYYFGYEMGYKFFSDSGEGMGVRVILRGEGVSVLPNAPSHLFHAIRIRHTNRGGYAMDSRFDEIKEIFETATNLQTHANLRTVDAPQSQVFSVTDKERRHQLADITLDAMQDAMANSAFREELSRYVLPNSSLSPVGMPGFGFGMPTPVSFLFPKIVRRFNVGKLTRKPEEKVLKFQTPAFGVLCTRYDSPQAWIEAGMRYEHIALRAAFRGLSTHPLAGGIEIGEHYKRIQQVLGTDFRPQVFFRIGKPVKSMRHSPRISAELVTATNLRM